MPPGLHGARGVAAAEHAVEGGERIFTFIHRERDIDLFFRGKAGPGAAIRPNMEEAQACAQARKQHLETAIPTDAVSS